ncbi:MAG: glycoside hydrolase family 13 protein [Fibrobacterales bacterium]
MDIPLNNSHNFAPSWVKSAIFYQIFPDRFARSSSVTPIGVYKEWGSEPTYANIMGGNLRGVIEKLDYLTDLGITALYLCPIFTSASNHRYHTHDYFEIDPILGTLDDFKELIAAAHDRDIKIVLDGVFNHCSRGFFQFNSVLEQGEESPFTEWFHINHYPIKPYTRTKTVEYECWWNNKALPKFNTDNAEVRNFIFSVAEYWLSLGIDGWRLDVPNEIDDDSFWREFRKRVKAINADAYIVGEIWDDPSRWLAGDQFDAVMNYRIRQAVLNVLCKVPKGDQSSLGNKISTEHFLRLLQKSFTVSEPHAQMNLLGSHDTHRIMTIAKGSHERVMQAFALLFFLPGAPCIYYGDEIGLAGGADPECRRCFPWDTVEAESPLFVFVKEMISLRKRHRTLQSGACCIEAKGGALTIIRTHLGDRVSLTLEIGSKSTEIVINEG